MSTTNLTRHYQSAWFTTCWNFWTKVSVREIWKCVSWSRAKWKKRVRMRHVSEEWDQSALAKCRRQLISASLLDFDALRKMSVTGRCQMWRVTRRPVSLSPPKRFFSLSQTKSWVFHELQICHAARFHLQVHWVGGWVGVFVAWLTCEKGARAL